MFADYLIKLFSMFLLMFSMIKQNKRRYTFLKQTTPLNEHTNHTFHTFDN